jgi:hypothetical protein
MITTSETNIKNEQNDYYFLTKNHSNQNNNDNKNTFIVMHNVIAIVIVSLFTDFSIEMNLLFNSKIHKYFYKVSNSFIILISSIRI